MGGPSDSAHFTRLWLGDSSQVMATSRSKALAELRALSLEELRAFRRFLGSDGPGPELVPMPLRNGKVKQKPGGVKKPKSKTATC